MKETERSMYNNYGLSLFEVLNYYNIMCNIIITKNNAMEFFLCSYTSLQVVQWFSRFFNRSLTFL